MPNNTARGKVLVLPEVMTAQRDSKDALPSLFECGRYGFDFEARTHIMGILNVTPDSFSDGGKFLDHRLALDHARRMADAGADIIDVGGESTRPFAPAVSLEEERRRVIPLIEELANKVAVPLSIDTTKVAIAREALDAGAAMVNDISSFRFEPEMAALVSKRDVPVVLMHMRGTPRTMQNEVEYDSLMDEIRSFLQERIDYAVAKGIDQRRIIIDPGIGFGKSVPGGNLTIIKHLSALKVLCRPILVGLSRKAFIGRILGREAADRDEGTAAALALAVSNGADIVRVHNVERMKQVVLMVDAIESVR